MILQRIRTFDGVQIIAKNPVDNILFNHCSRGESILDVHLPYIVELLQAHGVKTIVVEDSDSVKELSKPKNR
jgi:hypothetical protein